ncbi:MAG: class I SAM-dependent methyltransferase [Ignavibacteriae bacterium]|nr:class I SAM-dependent methyltransferase [Ignavibacteriota bacterium]
MKEEWNNRFNTDEYIFGKEPNDFFKEEIDKLTVGKMLCIAAGEGRNAVYAAKLGWNVNAIDYSEVGKQKAGKLAIENNVVLNYRVQDFFEEILPTEKYDVIVVINFHFEEEVREHFNQKIIESLIPNGRIILQVFDKEQIKKNSGGPKDINLLYTLEDIVNSFYDLEFELFVKENTTRFIDDVKKEATIIRFVGKKV